MCKVESESHPRYVALFDKKAYLSFETCIRPEISESRRYGAVGFVEEHHLFGHFVAQLFYVFYVISPYADDFGRGDGAILKSDCLHTPLWHISRLLWRECNFYMI